MKLQFIGSGDAFGSGGRLNTCFHVIGEESNFLIDCGASSLIGLKKHNIDLNDIDTILFTHFHADHFGGIPFFMLDAQFFSKRTEPLTLVGPQGLDVWYERVMETSFPGSSKTKVKFNLMFIQLEPMEQVHIGQLLVTPYPVVHGNADGPFYAYRIECEGRVIAYTGDTEWTDTLIDAGYMADLFIAEAYFYEKKVKFHLDYRTLNERLSAISPKRLVLTHMSEDMLAHLDDILCEVAEDGKILEF